MSTEHDEPRHASSPTDHVLQELQLYGYRPLNDDPDPRPLPEADRVTGAIADIFDALIATLPNIRLEAPLARRILFEYRDQLQSRHADVFVTGAQLFDDLALVRLQMADCVISHEFKA